MLVLQIVLYDPESTFHVQTAEKNQLHTSLTAHVTKAFAVMHLSISPNRIQYDFASNFSQLNQKAEYVQTCQLICSSF